MLSHEWGIQNSDSSGGVVVDWKEFSRLYKVSIPKESEFEYYLSTLERSARYAELRSWVASFADLEKSLAVSGDSLRDFKLRTRKTLLEHLRGTRAYQAFIETKRPPKVAGMAFRVPSEDTLFSSVDLVEANHSLLVSFDEWDELVGSWGALCEQLGVHPALARSKTFRQVVHGQLEPKHSQALQQHFMAALLERAKEYGYERERHLAFFSHDEFILEIGKEGVREEMEPLLSFLGGEFELDLRLTYFREQSLAKGRALRRICSFDEDGDLREVKRVLRGVPRSEFFLYFKRYVLEEPYDERDLYFWSEGKLAQWVV